MRKCVSICERQKGHFVIHLRIHGGKKISLNTYINKAIYTTHLSEKYILLIRQFACICTRKVSAQIFILILGVKVLDKIILIIIVGN